MLENQKITKQPVIEMEMKRMSCNSGYAKQSRVQLGPRNLSSIQCENISQQQQPLTPRIGKLRPKRMDSGSPFVKWIAAMLMTVSPGGIKRDNQSFLRLIFDGDSGLIISSSLSFIT